MQSARGLLLLFFEACIATLNGISWSGPAESQDDVQLEIQVPFWIDGSDVHVAIGEHQLHVGVRNTICFSRTYWTSR